MQIDNKYSKWSGSLGEWSEESEQNEVRFTEGPEQRHKQERLHVGRRGLRMSRAEGQRGASGFYRQTREAAEKRR